MKKIVAVAAAVMAASMFTFAGCSNKNTKNVTALYSNWYPFITFKKIQPTHMGENNAEVVNYDITFTKPEAGNASYSVSYGNGTYTTTFYGVKFDLALTHEAYRQGYEEAREATAPLDGGEKAITAYYYKTERYLPSVQFTFGNEKTEEFEDSLITECYFLSVEDHLRPLYSKQTIVSHTPANYNATSLASTYRVMNREIVNYFNYPCTEAKTTVTFKSGDYQYDEKKPVAESTHTGLNGTPNSLFDFSSLDIVVRANGLSPSLSQSVSLFMPENGLNNFALTGSEGSLGDEEKQKITNILKDNDLYAPNLNDKNEDLGLKTVAVKLRYSNENSGVSQTYWFAAVNSKTNNVGRGTMVKISTPVAYGLGTLNYVLSSVDKTLWNE